MHRLRSAWTLVRDAFSEWSEDKAPRLGAALAYYTVFSLAPLVIVAITITGVVFGTDAARSHIIAELRSLLGDQAAGAIQDMLVHAQQPGTGLVAGVVGGVTLLLGASGVFGQLQDALNTVWEVEPKPGRGIRGFIRDRFLSITMVLGTGFLLLVSLLLSAAIAAAAGVLRVVGPGVAVLTQGIEMVLSLGVTTVLFALIFKLLPDAEVHWRDVWVGAGITALLFVVGKVAIGLYLGHGGIASAYGAAGSLVVLLVWVYYSAQILLFGAEVTQVYAKRRGARVQPAPYAVKVTERDRAEQGTARSA